MTAQGVIIGTAFVLAVIILWAIHESLKVPDDEAGVPDPCVAVSNARDTSREHASVFGSRETSNWFDHAPTQVDKIRSVSLADSRDCG
jgi:hypothetical protein